MRELHDLHAPTEDAPWRRTLVVEVGDELLAAGTVRLGQRHPARYWLALNVAPAWRRRGIGSRLLADLRTLTLHDLRPFRVQARPSDAETMRFLQHRGFRPFVQTWEGVIDPQDPEVLERLARLSEHSDRYRVMRSRAKELHDALPAIASFYEDWYHAIHAWDPPARWSIERSLDHFCGPDLVPGSVTCVYRDNVLVGAGSLIIPPFNARNDEVYLVQLGVLGVEPPEAQTLTARLVAESLMFAASNGNMVRFEVDDTHPDL